MGFNLQGLDYTYNLQGWLKAINHSTLDLNDDPGGAFTYDRNGNIQTTTRWGDDNGAQVIDEFLYDYQTHNNQLNRVDDNTAILAWIVPLPVFT